MDQLRDLTAEHIVCVKLADIPVDADLTKVSDDQRVLPGQSGMVDCAAIVRHLAETGYDGPVTVMPSPGRFTGMTRDAIVQLASNSLDEVWKAAGLNRAGKPESVTADVQ